MKLWRKQAEQHNLDAGKKHQGRKLKTLEFKWPKHVLMSDLLKALYARVGMSPVDTAVREKIAELEAA